MPLFRTKPSRADFDKEVLPHLQALHSAALRMTRNARDAEDLVQDALLRAYRFFDTFEAGSNAKAWVFRILTNVFCSRYRERVREQEILDEARSSEANVEQFVAEAAAQGGDMEAALFGHMLSADVERALAAVPSDFRLAVILADLEDFSYKEIAEIMDCPAGTVMSRLYRGRKMLQSLLLDYAVEQGIVSSARGSDKEREGAAPIDMDAFRRRRQVGEEGGQ